MSDLATELNSALEGRYRLERELGAGGMATVFLARDFRHGRAVALKVLRPELAAMIGRDRFLAEIRTTANLQHPHILPLFDSGEADGHLYYVMPHVQGESLREKLDREQQLAVADAVRIATDIAEALGHAHRHGIIHRDIKPANVLIQDGQPVVSDFGIALAVGLASDGRLTETGLSLGTPHYMSPEQATGTQTVGPAADIYAMGCVLYEMLVGEPPYTGANAQAVLTSILTGEPGHVASKRKSVPANVDAVVAKSLEKLPADRFASAEEFASALADPTFRHGDLPGAATTGGGRWRRGLLAVGGMVIAAGFGGAAANALRQPPAAIPAVTTRFTFSPPADVSLSDSVNSRLPSMNRGFAISPDNRTLVFSDAPTGHLYRRDLGQLSAVPIPNTEDAWLPFFSPDGEWVGFFAMGANLLKKVRLDGTDLQTVTPVPPTVRSAGWASDGTIVLHTSGLAGLRRVHESGGDLESIAIDAGPPIVWLDLLPAGNAVVAGQAIQSADTVIVAVRLDTGERIRLPLPGGTTPRYVASGHLVFWRSDALWAVPFDAQTLSVTGEPTQIVRGVTADYNTRARFAVNEQLLMYQPGTRADGPAANEIVVVLDWLEELRMRSNE